jgi:sugar phosphate permease
VTAQLRGARIHYGWFAVALAFLTMLTAAGIRSTPGVLMQPLEADMHWSAATISFAVSLNIALFGLMGPFTAALMQSIGVRTTMLIGLGICAAATATTSFIQTPAELVLTWGVCVGLGAGLIGSVVAATISARWFVAQRGLVTGILSAANATGQLVFLPFFANVVTHHGWRPMGLIVAAIAVAVGALVALFMRETPASLGMRPFGATPDWTPPAASTINPVVRAFAALRMAVRRPVFWLLAGTFFVCGASTAGFIGTHFIPACGDHGIPETQAAGLLATMGAFDLVGTVMSGWLSDRVDPRWLLFAYYGLRGLALLLLPYAFGITGIFGLPLFAMFYGLDWLATLPPTVRLTLNAFGDVDGPVVFGWIAASHQLGAAAIVAVAGLIRTTQGSYDTAFMLSAVLCIVAALVALSIGRGRRAPAAAASPA